MRRAVPLLVVNVALLAGGVLAAGTVRTSDGGGPSTVSVPVPSPSPSPRAATAGPAPRASSASPAAASPSPRPVAQPKPQPSPVPVRRAVVRTRFAAYASAGPVTLHYPVDVVEVVGLHESGHDGAQPQSPIGTLAPIGALDSRSRDTNRQGAADVVVDPRGQVRSPVTGTVIRAGSYTLYCDHTDDYLVVEPDARPGWEVKLLHFEGLSVRTGDRVRAGVTVVGSRARVLPFESQVDEHTVTPHWPHLHIEVVDPSVTDRPSGRSCD